jgi:DNA helicase-2/ATP-dependent DNA helicase PcrA
MTGPTPFDTLYSKLNLRQKEAVDAIEGPVMVIAGPGTGKTSILTIRIANILKQTDAQPDNILALTFTESGVYSMRKKLVELIGSRAYKVAIHTFHGFADGVIKKYPQHFPRIIGAEHITDIDQIRILEEIIEETDLKMLKPFGDTFYYLKPALGSIQTLKRENISVDEFGKRIKEQEKQFRTIEDLYHEKGVHKGKMKGKYVTLEDRMEKNKELLSIYRQYEKKLQKGKQYDYEDMIMETVRVLESNNSLLLSLQEQFHYILADEHQDTNFGQNKMLELLANFHPNPNLFIVGDEKQAIFRFQGASVENFLYFKRLYPNALLINLEHNYRSTQTILDAAHSLMEKNSAPGGTLRTRLLSNSSKASKQIRLYGFENPEEEIAFLVSDIERRILSGTRPEEMAVIYRNNRDALPMAESLEKTKIPFVIESDQDLLNNPDIRKFIAILKVINRLGDDALLTELLHIDFFELEPISVYRLLYSASSSRKALSRVMSSRSDMEKVGIDEINTIRFSNLSGKLASWSKAGHNKNLIDILEIVVRESGFLSYILKSDVAALALEALEAFFSQARNLLESHPYYRLRDFINYLEVLERYKLLLKVRSNKSERKEVRLMTAHRSKGLEFEVVYIINCTDGHWGNRTARNHFHLPIVEKLLEQEENEDERRLFYVALTRAKHDVILTYAHESGGKHQLPCQFIEEVDREFLEEIIPERTLISIDARALAFKEKQNYAPVLGDKTFLNGIFLDQGFSVSALNNYLRCPWEYFFNNLVRVPKSPSKSQRYGTAIHNALKKFLDLYKESGEAKKKVLLQYFEDELTRGYFSEGEFDDLLEKGQSALGGYFDQYNKIFSPAILNEYSISGVEILIETDQGQKQVLLKGILDRIQAVSGELDGRDVVVYDYKTGKPKSRNELEGKTKNATGDYKRQLTFYRLLLEREPLTSVNSKRGSFSFSSAIIDFIEPDDRGRYHREQFFVTDGEVIELVTLIQKVSKEILDLDFWDKRCDDKKCEYCRLREMVEEGKRLN